MARSLVSSITRPISSLVSPVLRPAIRLAKHPLAPLGMGVAGMIVENVAEQVGLTGLFTKLGVQGVEFVKGGVKTGLTTIAGIADFDGEDDPPKTETKTVGSIETTASKILLCPKCPPGMTGTLPANGGPLVCSHGAPIVPQAYVAGAGVIAGTPNAFEAASGIHVGCAADKACGPCAKKQLLAKVGAALETMTPDEIKDFEVGLARKPLVPRTHNQVATYASSSASNAQAQIAALQTQLAQAQDAVTQQKLVDQIAAMQAQLNQATALAANAQAGGSLAALLAQLTQLKSIEALLTPAPTQSYGSPPWGVEENVNMIQDPNGFMYEDPSYGEGEGLVDPMNPMASFDPYGGYGDPYDPMVTRGIAEDLESYEAVSEETAVSGSVNEYMQPQGDEEPLNLDLGPRDPEVVLDDEIDCESCQRIY